MSYVTSKFWIIQFAVFVGAWGGISHAQEQFNVSEDDLIMILTSFGIVVFSICICQFARSLTNLMGAT